MSPDVRPGIDPAGPADILLLRLRRIGDIVMTMPAAALLRTLLPRATLTYLVEVPYRRLVEGHPDVDAVIAVPEKQNRREFLKLLRAVRRRRFDVLLDFHGGPRASWITAFSGAGTKIGYALPGKGWLYDVRVPRRADEGTLHSVQTHAHLVRGLGLEFADADIPPLRLPDPTPAEKSRLDAILTETGLAAGRFMVLHIGAGNAFRDWGEDRCAELIGRLRSRDAGLGMALIGGPADRSRQDVLLARLAPPAGGTPGRVIGLAGRLNLIETKELIARAVLFAGPDSGPMHLAAATPTPIVAVFGPTLPAHFSPWRAENRSLLLQKELDCRPCRQRTCLTSDFRCLRTIASEEVAAACLRFL